MDVKSVTPAYRFATFAMLILSGCATTDADWQEVQRRGTAESYQWFLRIYPKAEQAGEAKRVLAEMRAEEAWRNAEHAGTLQAYEKYLKAYPNSKHLEQAANAIDNIHFQRAKSENKVSAYDEYLLKYPHGANVQEANEQLQKLYLADAKQKMDLESVTVYLNRYPEGPDADMFRAALPGVRAFEKHRMFASAIMKHAPQTTYAMDLSGLMAGGGPQVKEKITTRSDPTAEDLARLKAMLADGADPNAARVAGFEPTSEVPLGGGLMVLSMGNPGRVVKAEEGGMTLLEYCRANGLDTIAEMLTKNSAKK